MNSRSISERRALLVSLLVIAAFFAGIVADRSGWLPGASRYPPPSLGRTIDPFWETWNLAAKNYVDREAVQPARLTRGAIEGLLDALGDEGHTRYLDPNEHRRFETDLQGSTEGIGVRTYLPRPKLTVVETFAGTPARAAGLKPGDLILKIDGKDITGVPMHRIVEMIRGPAGSTVQLHVLRKGEIRPIDLTITREKIDMPAVSWQMLSAGPVLHLAVREFNEKTHEKLKMALREARDQQAKGLILDLRRSPGGLKDQAVAVASEFLDKGDVLLEQDASGRRTAIPVRGKGQALDLPLCVLIDDGTASCAEIVAGALQDHGRAKLIGTRTSGKATVLMLFPLSDGSAVLLAIGEWLTPKGRKILRQGIAPDVEIPLPLGVPIQLPAGGTELDAAILAKTEDKQLLKALAILQEEIAARR